MSEEIREAVQIIEVAYDGIEIAMKVGSGGIDAMQKAIDFLKGIYLSIDLYSHNRTAYEKAKILINETGKAAIIHPTGTGKSYIAFAFVEENPDRKFLWFAPSTYIYKLQITKLKEEQGITFSNVEFHTYSWLLWNNDTISQLRADYIILDEFHRVGALEWGKSVQKLIKASPETRLLGLTATNIRYLDNQRDMAIELFDGAIASEMELCEAMVRKILPMPKYVISVYNYVEQLEEYQKRINAMRKKTKKEQSQKLLEQIRRALEQAIGVDEARYFLDKGVCRIKKVQGREWRYTCLYKL